MEVVHTHGYLITDIGMEMLHFCAAARKLFLSDISTLRADTEKLGLTDVPNTWRGGPQYAPLAAHLDGNRLKCMRHLKEALEKCGPYDELEAVVFLCLELAVGDLPWSTLRADDVLAAKQEAIDSGALFRELPEQ